MSVWLLLAMKGWLVATLIALSGRAGLARITCDDGSQSLPCCSDGSTASAGANCPDGSPPTDTCGSCTAGEATVECIKEAAGSSGFGVANPCGSIDIVDGPVFAAPPVAESSNGSLTVTLEVVPGTLDAGLYSFQARMFRYNGATAAPGPTLKFKAGDTVSVTLVNSLSADGNDATKAHNTLRLPNTTNIHTHGIHVDPATDNVYLGVEPGASHTYVYEIPSTHMPGLHWYHSHQHGASALHLMGGLVGALVIDDTNSTYVPAPVQALTSHVMVVTHVAVCSCNPTRDPFRIVSYQELMSGTGDTLPLRFQAAASNTAYGGGSVLLVNGQHQPKLSLTTGAWSQFDVVNAVGDSYMEIEIRTAVNAGDTACSMVLLAIDGVYLQASRAITSFMFAAGGRASIAVMCDTSGTYYFQSYPQNRAADFEACVRGNLVTLEVSGGSGATADAPSWAAGSFESPWYLKDLRGATVTGEWTVGVEQTAIASPAGAHLGVGADCTIPCSGRSDCASAGFDDPNQYGSCPYVPFEGHHSGAHYRHVGKLCTVEDVVIWGRGATAHPMHIHVNHFQVVSVADRRYAQYWGELGDFRDTMPAFVGASRVRYALADFGGVIIQHCHFLYHEDHGMMDRFWVGDGATFCVAGGTYPDFTYCDSGVGADGWSATPASIHRQCTDAEIDAMGLGANWTPYVPTQASADDATDRSSGTVSGTSRPEPLLALLGFYWAARVLSAPPQSWARNRFVN